MSDEEFELLRVRSETEGARSLSDYARAALCEAAKPSPDLCLVRDEIEKLRADLARTLELMALRGPVPARPVSVAARSRTTGGRNWQR